MVAEFLARKGVTKVAPAPMDPKLSASKLVAYHRPEQLSLVPAPRPVRPRRNWAAQAEYDREHGTENGYDPLILQRDREQ
jgi:hypothetical protein